MNTVKIVHGYNLPWPDFGKTKYNPEFQKQNNSWIPGFFFAVKSFLKKNYRFRCWANSRERDKPGPDSCLPLRR
jgi:hypothetical protein